MADYSSTSNTSNNGSNSIPIIKDGIFMGNDINNKKFELKKILYSRRGVGKNLNTSFEEIFNEEDKIDLDTFFNSYDNLFYDIPKEGIDSHKTIYKRSKDYLNDFKNTSKDEFSKNITTTDLPKK